MSEISGKRKSPPSPYKRGADNGMYFGVYLCGMFFSFILTVKLPIFSLVFFAMMVGVPFMIYRWLRRSYVEDYGTTLFSSLWMQGIMIFLCGSLIAGAVTTIYLKWINPDFIVNLLHRAIEVWRSSDLSNAREMAAVAQKMIDYNLVPSAIEIAVEMIWLSVFSGSILSLLMSLLARSKSVRRNAEIP